MTKAIRITLSLNEETKEIIYTLAARKHQTLSQVVRDALVSYNESEKE